jgi:gliding motility associated protien GldN
MKINRFLWLSNFLLFFLVLGSNKSVAQYEYQDFTYNKEAIKERKVVPYPFLVERDVMYCRRIWRIIDTREKMNLIMKWPRNPLFRIIYDAATKGYGSAPIPAYRNDSLTSICTAEEILLKGKSEEAAQIPDPNDPESDRLIDTVIRTPFNPNEIVRYLMMEDWIFDKQTSQFFIRIIAIAPLYREKVTGVSGIELGESELFWVKWTDFRPVLVNQEIFNRANDAMRFSYDDFFDLRMFTSYISKESNAFDNKILDYEEFRTDKFAALLESEKIKNKLFEWEHDLWEY